MSQNQIRPKQSVTSVTSKKLPETKEIWQEILETISKCEGGLKNYPIRTLVEQAEKFGEDLQQRKLQTNQVRKFLDAINRLKIKLVQSNPPNQFSAIKNDVVLLKPKAAYVAAKQKAAKPLSDVISNAIDQVDSTEDFYRLVQLVESIIAYHKAAGEK